MHNTEQNASGKCSRVIELCSQSLDLVDALQSIETQRLKLVIERRKKQLSKQEPSQNLVGKMIPVRQPDITIRSRRAA